MIPFLEGFSSKDMYNIGPSTVEGFIQGLNCTENLIRAVAISRFIYRPFHKAKHLAKYSKRRRIRNKYIKRLGGDTLVRQ